MLILSCVMRWIKYQLVTGCDGETHCLRWVLLFESTRRVREGKSAQLIPELKMREYKRPPKTIDRIPDGIDGHEQDWVRACKGGKPACCNFDYAGPLTETVLLGNLAIRYSGKKLDWDGPNMKVTNVSEANEYIHRQYRQGWTL